MEGHRVRGGGGNGKQKILLPTALGLATHLAGHFKTSHHTVSRALLC